MHFSHSTPSFHWSSSCSVTLSSDFLAYFLVTNAASPQKSSQLSTYQSTPSRPVSGIPSAHFCPSFSDPLLNQHFFRLTWSPCCSNYHSWRIGWPHLVSSIAGRSRTVLHSFYFAACWYFLFSEGFGVVLRLVLDLGFDFAGWKWRQTDHIHH